jgi:Ras-related protein Rab-1A
MPNYSYHSTSFNGISEPSPDYLFRLVMLGDSLVGKTCIITRFADDRYYDSHVTTIGVDFRIKVIETSNNTRTKLHVWDTAGQERFRTIIQSYYRGADGIVVVFSVTDRPSFENVKFWIEEVRKHSKYNARIILVANKVDEPLEDHKVTTEEINEFSSSVGISTIEASAKENINIDRIFKKMSEELILIEDHKREHDTDNLDENGRNRDDSIESIDLEEDNKKKSRCTC